MIRLTDDPHAGKQQSRRRSASTNAMAVLAAESALADVGAERQLRYAPCSTYRLQLNRLFTFRQATELLDYLQDLGISDFYASPFLMARPGSMHGYDVTDPTRLNPEVGDAGDFHQFAGQLKQRGMGLIADVVPNHMCVTHPSNIWWWDVLEDGPGSPYARFFDIDWNPPKSELANKVLLPFLAEQFGRTLEDQQLVVTYRDGAFFIDCLGVPFPLAADTWWVILRQLLHRLHSVLESSHPYVLELASILSSIRNLSPHTETDAEKVAERRRRKAVIKGRLVSLLDNNGAVRQALEESLGVINGRKGDPHSFDRLEKLLDAQVYRLSHWQVAADEVNYRRFFDINELAAIRVEDPEVFASVHALIFDLVARGHITGLRIDHPDGLFDPEQYFHDLQEHFRMANPVPTGCDPGPWQGGIFLIAEKVLVGQEELRRSWEVAGTTGYSFLNLLNGLFVDKSRKRALLRLYEQFTGWSQSFNDLVYECKRLVLQVSMSSELTALSRRLNKITEQHRWSRDFTLNILRDALQEVIACFPVYRSYIRETTVAPDEEDKQRIRQAIDSARRRNAAISSSVFHFIQDLLLLNDPEGIKAVDRDVRRLFVMRFQQLTGAVMAKGLEDTAFYRYAPLLSLNEVGGSPRSFGTSVAAFHARNAARAAMWPDSLLATSTHDHKRSEDVRARINVLSEIPTEWYRAIRSWQQINSDKTTVIAGKTVPDPNEQYYLYQTLIGAWPLSQAGEEYREFIRRVHVHMEKALREAKVHSSWVSPNGEYENAVHQFLDAILAHGTDNAFLSAFLPFQARVARLGVLNSLSQLVLKMASPGVPDFYQGTEVWNFSFADPDNRRPVDYESIRHLLAQLQLQDDADPAALVDRLIQSPESGGIKLYITRAALRFRQAQRDLFAKGDYLALRVSGQKQRHVVAFARAYRGQRIVVIAGRLFAQLKPQNGLPIGGETWGDTVVTLRRHFAHSEFREIFTARTINAERGNGHLVIPLSTAFAHLPLALYAQREGGRP